MDGNFLSLMKQFVTVTDLHPVLVNFTAALIPVSVANDLAGRLLKKDVLNEVGWRTLLYAAFITPLTALAGWLFWMKDDEGVPGMMVHKWLGTALAVLLVGLFAWRWRFYRKGQKVSWGYLAIAIIFVGLLVLQGYLGGSQVFKGM